MVGRVIAVRRASVGLRESLGRFQTARQAQLIDHVTTSAIEATMWVTVLDELRGTSSSDQAKYRQERDAHSDGRFVLGLRHARNRGVHAFAADQKWDAVATGWTICWAATEHAEDRSEVVKAYNSHLAGVSVIDSLCAAARWLDVMLIVRSPS